MNKVYCFRSILQYLSLIYLMFVLFVDEVQGPAQVRITDFGLAKLLNYNEEHYQATGGKVSAAYHTIIIQRRAEGLGCPGLTRFLDALKSRIFSFQFISKNFRRPFSIFFNFTVLPLHFYVVLTNQLKKIPTSFFPFLSWMPGAIL